MTLPADSNSPDSTLRSGAGRMTARIPAPRGENPSLVADRQLDAECRRFEQAWRDAHDGNAAPKLDAWLADVPQVTEALVRELVLLDAHYRRKRGIPIEMSEYEQVHPAFDVEWLNQPPELPTSRRIGEYELLSEIARGGMGIVYKAKHVSLQRVVALKTILGGNLASALDVERFQREARAAAKLDHPHIIPIYDVGECEGIHYFTMRFIDGTDLRRVIDRYPKHPRTAAKVMLLVGEAVAHAHSKGVLHRDLKPANVLLEGNIDDAIEELTPYVTDFGLAKHLDEEQGETRTHEFLGTPTYMSPEQAAGNTRQISTATDVYALGAILRTLLTGRVPFSTSNLSELLDQIQNREPPPIVDVNPNVPVDLMTICDAAMRKDPSRRYATAAAFVEDVRAFLQGHPISARKTRASERVVKWIQRHPLPTAFAATLLVLASTFVAAMSWQWREAVLARNLSEERAKAEGEANHRAQKALQSLNVTNYYQAIARAALELDSNNAAVTKATLEGCDPVLRGWEWHYLKTLLDAPLFTISIGDGPASAIAFSPNGRQLAVSQGLGATGDRKPRRFEPVPVSVTLFDIETASALRSFSGVSEQIKDLNFSHDGKMLFASTGHYERSGSGELIAWDVETGNINWHVKDKDLSIIWDMELSPDGSTLAMGSGHRLLFKDIDGKLEVRTLPFPALVHTIAFHPQGKQIAVSQGEQIAITDIESGVRVATLSNLPGIDVRSLAWHPSGRKIAAGFYSGHGTLVDVETGDCQTLLVPDGSHSASVSTRFAMGGRVVTMSRADGSLYFWPLNERGELSLKTPWILRGQSGRGGMVVSPGGYLMAISSMDGNVNLWDIGREQLSMPQTLTGGRIEAMANSSDGQYTFTAGHFIESRGERGQLNAWSQSNGQFIKTIDSRKGGYSHIAVSHDDHLAYDCGSKIKIRERSEPVADSEEAHANVKASGVRDNWREWLEFSAHEGAITALAFHPTKNWLASAGDDGRIRGWRFSERDGVPQAELDVEALDVHETISCLKFSSDGEFLISCNTAGVVELRDPLTLKVKVTKTAHSAPIVSLAVHPLRRQFVTSDQSGGTSLWDIDPPSNNGLLGIDDKVFESTITLRHSVIGHSQRIRDLAFSPDGTRVVSTGEDPVVVLWDSGSAHQALTFRRFAKPPRCAIFSNDGNQLLVAVQNWLVPFARVETAEERERRVVAWRTAESSNANRGAAKDDSLAKQRFEEVSDPLILTRNAWALAEGRHWDDAKRASDRAASLKEFTDSLDGLGFSHCWLRMAFGGKDEVRKMCDRLLVQFEHDDNPMKRYLCGVVCGYRPDSVSEPARLVSMLREALEKAPERIYIWEVLGVAYIRAGEWEEAIKAAKRHRELERRSHGIDFFVESFAYARLGKASDARRAFRDGVNYFERDGAYERRSGTRLLDYRSFRAEATEELKAFDMKSEASPGRSNQ